MSHTAVDMQAALEALGNPKNAIDSQRYFKCGPGEYGEGDILLGIRMPVLREQVFRFQQASLAEIALLLPSPLHEIRHFALLLLVRQYEKGDEAARQAIYELYLAHFQYVNNWDLVDSTAPRIVGWHLATRDRSILDEWAASDRLWDRRIAVLATFHFIRNREFDDILRLAEALLKDEEDLMHKAVGWMLREMGKRDKETELSFLRQHYRVMPRTMLRYAIEKFPAEERRAFLKGEI